MPEDSHSIRDDLPVIASSVATVVAAIAAVSIDHNLATVATAAGAVVTALIGYRKASKADANARAVAHIAADATLDTNARTVLVQTVTAERAVWRREMRSAAAELTTILRELDPAQNRDWTRLDRLASEIRLRLNPAGRQVTAAGGKHALDYVIHACLDALDGLDRTAGARHAGSADALERAVADLLKHEWDRSKGEAVSGRIGERDGADGDPVRPSSSSSPGATASAE